MFTHLHSQTAIVLDITIPITPLTQGYVIESINGRGFSQCTGNHISNISSSNPASISDYKRPSFGISYQRESVVNPAIWNDIKHQRNQKNIPQSIGFLLPINQYVLGFGFSQRYDSKHTFGPFEIFTFDDPDGTGEYLSISKEESVNSYSGMVSYSFENFLKDNNTMNLGIQVHYNTLRINSHGFSSGMKVKASNFGWTAGARYNLSDKTQIGAYYERIPKFKNGEVEFDGITLTPLENPEDSTMAFIYEDVSISGEIPDRFHVGISNRIFKSTIITLDLTNVYWKQLSSTSKNFVDVSGGIIQKIGDQLSLSLSFLSTGRHFNNENYFQSELNKNLKGFFLLGGVNLKIHSLDIDLAYAASAFNTGDWRKQKLGKISLGYAF